MHKPLTACKAQGFDDSLKDINTENKASSSASSRRLPVSAKAKHSASKRVKSDLVVEQVFSKDNWKSLGM